jgi:hypothetical protein
MSLLLECGDHVVRQNKRWRYKVIAHCTGVTIFRTISIGMDIICHGTWIQFHDPVDSYIFTGSGFRWVIIGFHAVLTSKNI